MSIDATTSSNDSKLERIVLYYFRFVAGMMLIYGIHYWMMLIGLTDNAVRFDTMPNHWRVVAVTLSVLMPVASLGLWGFQRWGIAIWLIIILIEFTVYYGFSQLFGEKPGILIFHLCSFIVLIISQALIYLAGRPYK